MNARFFVFTILTGTLLGLSSCASTEPPLAPIANQHIETISIHGYRIIPNAVTPSEDRNIVLTEQADITFIVNHLKNLEPRLYDHSSPEFDLTIKTAEGGSLRLRVSRDEIGPGAPASAYNTHWFPKDRSLYDFLVAKTYGSLAR